MATGGETLEYRNETFYVNGRQLAKSYYPLVPKQIKTHFTITCPKNKYIVLISARAVDNGLVNLLKAGGALKVPKFKGNIVIGWHQACCVLKEEISDRAFAIVAPAPRPQFLQAKGPRLIE